ncbi:MAG: LacI family DNA-binding transcriptional regulator [Micrococcaceae bacterium]
MTKQEDVAKLAGVSVTTVSRVINNYGSLSEKTKEKVFSAMEELNYQPNVSARSLQGKSTQLVGLIFPAVSNPFFGELVQEIEDELFKKGYRVILCDAGQDHEKERDYLKMLRANQVAGIITGTHNRNIPEYEQTGLPIIAHDRHLAGGIPIVSSDNFIGGKRAAAQLLQANCKNIAVITGSSFSNSSTDLRVQGFKGVLKKKNLKPEFLELSYNVSPRVKLMHIKQLLSEKVVDGIFCTDDLTALLVLRIAEQLDIAVPKELKVIGYDGTKFIREYYPQLTTIVQPIKDMATLSVELLIKLIESPEKSLKAQYTLPVEVLAGETVGD